MPTTPSATTTVNGSAVTDAVAVAASSVVTLALASTFGVRSVTYTIVGNHSSAATNPTITPGAGFTATFTMPSGTTQGYLIEAKINSGRDELGRQAAGYRFRFIVGVIGVSGLVPAVLGEKIERGTYGWIELFNSVLEQEDQAIPLDSLTIDGGSLDLETYGAAVEANAQSGTLDYIDGIGGDPNYVGQAVTIQPASGDTIIVNDQSNGINIGLSGQRAFAMTDVGDRLTLRYDGSIWYEVARNYGAAYVLNVAGTTHTFTITDCNRIGGVVSTGASATEFTINQVSSVDYPVGSMISVTQAGAGVLTVGATSSATLNGSSGAARILLNGQYSSAVLWHRTSNAWIALGNYT